VRGVLGDALANGWLAPDAVVAVERMTRGGPWTWPAGFEPDRSRRYGEATLWYGHAGPSPAAPPMTEV
jgi:16S rRNA (guanine966-N2)-methyltransferase